MLGMSIFESASLFLFCLRSSVSCRPSMELLSAPDLSPRARRSRHCGETPQFHNGGSLCTERRRGRLGLVFHLPAPPVRILTTTGDSRRQGRDLELDALGTAAVHCSSKCQFPFAGKRRRPLAPVFGLLDPPARALVSTGDSRRQESNVELARLGPDRGASRPEIR